MKMMITFTLFNMAVASSVKAFSTLVLSLALVSKKRMLCFSAIYRQRLKLKIYSALNLKWSEGKKRKTNRFSPFFTNHSFAVHIAFISNDHFFYIFIGML